MSNKTQFSISIFSLILIILLSGCKKPPESDLNVEEAGVNKITIYKTQDGKVVSETYSPNDVFISVRAVEAEKSSRLQNHQKPLYNNEPPAEPNSLSEPKDYHYKLVFPPLDEPQTSDLLID